MIHLITSTYTFNYYYFINNNIYEEIRKKTLPIRGIRLNNVLAPKIRDFSTNVPHAGALAPIIGDNSEHFS